MYEVAVDTHDGYFDENFTFDEWRHGQKLFEKQ
jgi:hypothetical protein